MKHIFHTYEEFSEFCFPFEKNLAKGFTEIERFYLLLNIEKFYRQRLDILSESLDIPRTNTLIISNCSYLGRCHTNQSTIELDVSLICFHPIVLTEVIIHELTHYKYPHHKKSFFDEMERNVHKLGLENVLYGRDNISGNSSGKYPTSIFQWFNDFDNYKRRWIQLRIMSGKGITINKNYEILCSLIMSKIKDDIENKRDEQLIIYCEVVANMIMTGVNPHGKYDFYDKPREWYELVDGVYKYVLPYWEYKNLYGTFYIKYHYGWYLMQTRRFKLAYKILSEALDLLNELVNTDKKYNSYMLEVLKVLREAKSMAT